MTTTKTKNSSHQQTDGLCPFNVVGCPGFDSTAPMCDLCDDCYEGRRAEGETEEDPRHAAYEAYMEQRGEDDCHERRGC